MAEYELATQWSLMARAFVREQDEKLARYLGVRVDQLEMMLNHLDKCGLRVEMTTGPASMGFKGGDEALLEQEISFSIVRKEEGCLPPPEA